MSPAYNALYAVVRGIILVGLLLLAGTQCTAVLFGRSLRYATPQRLAVLHSRLSALPIRLLVILLAAFVARG
ncbi:MAG: hypothetical protein ACREL5_11660, partial [Gemmatimonadales bacterium]